MFVLNNWDLIPKNELSANARSGTELMLERLYDGNVARSLLEQVEIIPSRFRPANLDPSKKWIWYEHNLPQDPESAILKERSVRSRFSSFVFVSNWQLEKFSMVLDVPYSQSIVIPNAITPIQPKLLDDDFDRPIRLIYHTTPHRGLGILLPVFIELRKYFNITLDLYSSFKLYGWPDADRRFQPLFDLARQTEGVTVHEVVSNEQMRERLQEADIFAYPSVWSETSCLAGLEAISAGCIVVTPNLAALPETLGRYPSTVMYQWSEDANQHGQRFGEYLAGVLTSLQTPQGRQNWNDRINASSFVFNNSENNWNNGCQAWQNHLRNITSTD